MRWSFADILGFARGEIPSIVLTKQEHALFTSAWRKMIPYGSGTANATKESVLNAARIVNREFSEILDALQLK